MRFTLNSFCVVAASLSFVVATHDNLGLRHAARQDPASSSTPAQPSSESATASATAAPAPSASTTFTFSLASSEATAAPLSSITASATTNTAEFPTLSTTFPAGASPSLEGAPTLPEINIDINSYPPLDRTPPVDSDQVKEWIEEVKNSGIDIPDIAPTVAGGCAANPEAARNESICWWTCGGCTRDSDITTCPAKESWGLTFDDGPAPYTPQLLDYLDEKDLKATFFAVGSRCLSYPDTLRYEYMKGHQVASHTWAHPALTTLTNEQIIAEFGWTRQIIREVLGVSPNMFRPPFGDIDDRVRAIGKAMGMYAVMWTRISPTQTFDTHDFDIQNGAFTVEGVLESWEFILGNVSQLDTGFIALEHDLYKQSVEVATGYILPDAIAQGFDISPVVSCLNQPLENAYVETNDDETNPPAASGSGVVTLSSGAPGSAEQTGSSGGNDGDTGVALGASSMACSAVAALIAGFAVLL